MPVRPARRLAPRSTAAASPSAPCSIAACRARFHEARGVDLETIADIQAQVRRRLLRAAARGGLIEREEAQAMGAAQPAPDYEFDS